MTRLFMTVNIQEQVAEARKKANRCWALGGLSDGCFLRALRTYVFVWEKVAGIANDEEISCLKFVKCHLQPDT